MTDIVCKPARRGRKPKPPAGPPPGAEMTGVPAKPPMVDRDKVASRLWDDLIPILVAGRIVGPADVATLCTLCTAWSRLVRARGLLKKARSWVVTSEAGAMKAHPMLAIEQSACRDVMAAADKLGLSPTSRARIAYLREANQQSRLDPDMLDQDEVDDLDDILGS